MRGVVFLGDRKLELRESPDPTPGPRDVILEIKASGMCGTDLHAYRAPALPGEAVAGGIKRAGRSHRRARVLRRRRRSHASSGQALGRLSEDLSRAGRRELLLRVYSSDGCYQGPAHFYDPGD
jgi:NADPH:quinone reductase-like Zn-dependent oxidoreductase